MARDQTTIPLNHRVPPVRRGARGSISRLPSGSLRVRVHAGIHPVTGRQRSLSHTVPDGPTALDDAEAACRRLVAQVPTTAGPAPTSPSPSCWTATSTWCTPPTPPAAPTATRWPDTSSPGLGTSPGRGHPPEVLGYLYAAAATTATTARTVASSRTDTAVDPCSPTPSARSTT